MRVKLCRDTSNMKSSGVFPFLMTTDYASNIAKLFLHHLKFQVIFLLNSMIGTPLLLQKQQQNLSIPI